MIDKLYRIKREKKIVDLKNVREQKKAGIKQITTPTIPNHLNHFGYIHDDKNFYILELEQNDSKTVSTAH